jgi:hypothetical protein
MQYKNALKKAVYFLEGLFLKRDSLCPYCQSSYADIVFKKAYVIDICRCSQCGFYWTNPIFRFYRFYDFLYEGSGLTTNILKGKRLKQAIDENFKNSGKDYSFYLDRLEKNTEGKELLEFGSSWGYFLYQARKRNFTVTGIEISKKRREFGIENFEVKIFPSMDSLISQGKKFDIIVTFHTLEHLTYLGDIFKKFYMLLKDNGILVIEVPFLSLNKGKEAFIIMGAAHPLGFSTEFFIHNLPQEGFKVDLTNGFVLCKKATASLPV